MGADALGGMHNNPTNRGGENTERVQRENLKIPHLHLVVV